MRSLLSDVLLAIRPSKEESDRELAFARMMVDHVSRNAPAGATAVLVGSMAKGTFLRDKKDVDIFVLFDSLPRERLEAAIRDVMEDSFPTLGYQVSYAEHPYVRFHFQGRRIDLVPAYRISKASERLSAVDRSILHTDFVLKSMKKGQADEIILLKQFLRSNSLYGAEIKTEGFSGYLCELLIIRYRSFTALLRAASRWKTPVFIDLKGYHKGKKDIGSAIERFGSFVVIDPTDKDRNVAAAVSEANVRRFISLSKAFLKKPSKAFFFRTQASFEDKAMLAAKGACVFVVSMPRPDVVDDVLWGQLRKMLGQLEIHLADFCPKIFADDSRHLVRLAIAVKKDRLPDKMLVEGPPLGMEKHVAGFRKSHPKARFMKKKGRMYAEVKRPVVKAEDAIHSFFRSFALTKSHLAYPEEMVVLERIEAKVDKKRKKAVKGKRKSVRKKVRKKAKKGKSGAKKRGERQKRGGKGRSIRSHNLKVNNIIHK